MCSVDMTPQQLKVAEPKLRPSTPETLPGAVSSCSLEDIPLATLGVQGADDNGHANGHSGVVRESPQKIAPSSVCQQRKLSAAIVTGGPDAPREFVAGRPTVTVEDLAGTSPERGISPSSNLVQPIMNHTHNNGMPIYTTPPPRPSSNHHHRGISTNPKRNRELSAGSGNISSSSITRNSLTRQNSVPVKPHYASLVNDPHALRVDAWAEAPATTYSVRGCNYIKDNQKFLSEESLFSLLTVDVVQTANARPIMEGLCNHPNERIQRALRREKATGVKELPDFIFAINLAVPGPPFYHVMIYLGCDDLDALQDLDTPVGRLAKPFFFGSSDEYRDNKFKLIPRIVEGNFMVKKAVGSKPTILGKKLKQHYIRNSRFLELICDIESDSIAKKVVALSTSYCKTLITDMMFLLEGDTEDTLPERILGGVRLKNVDMKNDGHRKVHHYKV
jgi:Protein ENHANCED DISEASE RESISTANCE 2, C-terminal